MKEYTGTLNITIEVTIAAKNQKEASSFFDDLYANITIQSEGNHKIKILDERNNLDCIEWEVSELVS